jgi:hypothetical protein
MLMTILPHPPAVGVMANGNRRSQYSCSLNTTTGYFAARNAAGIVTIHIADPDRTHRIPAYGHLTFWSCLDEASPAPAGLVTAVICPANHLTTLTVTGLAALEHLDAGFNDLSSLDLAGLPALQTLILTKNRLAAFDTSEAPVLQVLDCYGNQLTGLDLTGRDRLRTLDCSMNRLLSLKLGGCHALETLYCYCNNLTELDLAALPALRDCNFNRNPLSPARELSLART